MKNSIHSAVNAKDLWILIQVVTQWRTTIQEKGCTIASNVGV